MDLPQLTPSSVIIGFDVHKYTHTGVAMNIMGVELGTLTFNNGSLSECSDWIKSLSSSHDISADDVLIGIEDIHSYGHHLACHLNQEKLALRYVPAKLTDRERRHSNQKDKSDYEDAKRVGKVMLHKMEQTLPADPIVAEDQKHIRLLDLHIQEREGLVSQQTKLKNQLHTLLHQHYGDDYKRDFATPFSQTAITWYLDDLVKDGGDYLAKAIKRRIDQLVLFKEQIREVDQLLTETSKLIPSVKKLQDQLYGCGQVTACKIISEIKTIKRFSKADKLARYGGFAPVRSQSGSRGRYYSDRGGNRRLNQAIHVVAMTQIARYKLPQADEYYQRKISEGKSKLWALRCLKRQLIKQVFILLQ